jgi:hypothetical protein
VSKCSRLTRFRLTIRDITTCHNLASSSHSIRALNGLLAMPSSRPSPWAMAKP